MNRKLLLAIGLVCFLHSVLAQTEVITNGGFETGTIDPWEHGGAGIAIGSNPGQAHSGTHYLTMGSVSSANQFVTQDFTIPTNAAAVALTYFWAVLSDNTTTPDQLLVRIIKSDHNTILANVDMQSNAATKGAYFRKTFDLTPFIG